MLHKPRPLLDAAVPWHLPSPEVRTAVREDPAAAEGRLPEEGDLHQAHCDRQARRAANEGNLRAPTDLPAEGHLRALHRVQEARRARAEDRLLQARGSRPQSRLPAALHRRAEGNLPDDRLPAEAADDSDPGALRVHLRSNRHCLHEPSRLPTCSLPATGQALQSVSA